MLLFQWNALRTGDAVMVHDDADPTAALHPGRVHTVESGLGTGGNDVGVRLAVGGSTIRPRRAAVHTSATGSRDCWRCHLLAAHRAAHDRTRLGVPDAIIS